MTSQYAVARSVPTQNLDEGSSFSCSLACIYGSDFRHLASRTDWNGMDALQATVATSRLQCAKPENACRTLIHGH